MAWRIDPFATPLSATSTLYTLPGMPSTGYEIRISGSNFTYDAATGFLNGGTIFGMSLVSTSGGFTSTIQTVTMNGGLSAANYFNFVNGAHDLQMLLTSWGVTADFRVNIIEFGPNLWTMTLANGDQLRVAGTGFVADSLIGTVTSIELWDAGGAVLHSATGLAQPLTAFATVIGDHEETYRVLVQGNNTITSFSDLMGYGIEGGAGNDRIVEQNPFSSSPLHYDNAASGVTVNLTTNTATGGDGTDTLVGTFNSIDGSAFNDTLTGTDSYNSCTPAAVMTL